jgi:WD40 repeat protein
MRGLAGGQHAIAFSPDGERLASAGELGITNIWDASTGRLVLTLRDLPTPVNALAFSPDGGSLLTGDKSGFLVIWDGTPAR